MKLYKPKSNARNPFYNHKGDTFREMVDIWNENLYVEVEEYDGNHIWLGNIGETLLYDRPTLDWLEHGLSYEKGLFGNPIAPKDLNNNSNWIFWARHPRNLHKKIKEGLKPFNERNIESIFIGKIENNIQKQHRDIKKWDECIEFFDLIEADSTYYKYTQEEYLNHLSNSKYGLSLRGFGGKCNREIELLGLGVVPLLHSNVDTTYYNSLEENVHYFKIDTPDDVKNIIQNTSKEIWEKMSKKCNEWYQKNASPEGSFKTTMEILENMQESLKIGKPTSLCTFCTNTCKNDLTLMLKSIEKYQKDIPIYLLCDEIIKQYVEENFKHLQINVKQVLDKYSNKDRKQMEKEGIFCEMMKLKSKSIDFAMQTENDTLYIDSDIVFLDKLPDVDKSKSVGLCPHFIKKANTDKYGYYNAGFVYVNDKNFSSWWHDAIDIYNKWDDQGTLEEAINNFSYFEFDMCVDFGWWRLLECDNTQQRLNMFNLNNQGRITFNGKLVNSLHTHFVNDKFHLTLTFNKFIIEHLINRSQTSKTYYKFITDHVNDHNNKDIINIICQYYNDDEKERQKEIDVCFIQNLNNPYVKRVINFNEDSTIVPDDIKTHPKYIQVDVDNRLLFGAVFDYANKHLVDECVCLCNADIFLEFNSKWQELFESMRVQKNMVYALSRHEFDGSNIYKDPTLNRLGYANSQDAWLFIPTITVENADFMVGTLGCDNAIADRLKKSGYFPVNSPNKCKIFHYDVCRKKTGANALEFSKNYEKYKEIANTNPEKDGQYLCPDIDMINSIDDLTNMLNLNKFQRYEIICDLFSKYLRVTN